MSDKKDPVRDQILPALHGPPDFDRRAMTPLMRKMLRTIDPSSRTRLSATIRQASFANKTN